MDYLRIAMPADDGSTPH